MLPADHRRHVVNGEALPSAETSAKTTTWPGFINRSSGLRARPKAYDDESLTADERLTSCSTTRRRPDLRLGATGRSVVSPQRPMSAEPTAPDDATVFVVDDDSDIRASLKQLFEAVNLRVELFESAEEFLRAERTESPGCLLLDVRMPGMGGLELLTHLRSLKEHPPVIMLTGHGDIPMVLQSLQSGALDFIEKPAAHQRLLASVNKALAVDRDRRTLEREKCRIHALFGTLSAREREVLKLMVGGSCSKAIALELGISLRTLEKHREHIMRKTGARSVSELIRAVLQHGCP